MRTAALVHDSLWRCLCPNYTLRVAQKPFVGIRHTKFSKPRRQIRGNASQASPHERQHSSSRLVKKKQPELDFFQYVTRNVGGEEQCQESAFEELKIASEKVEYTRVQAIVKYLVGNLGVKPNESIYRALISVNVDCQYGSAAEVASLLEEMERANVRPDAETYHAALRVLAIHPDQLLRDHILAKFQERWITLTNGGYHDVVAGLIRERHLELALDWVDRMPREGVVIEDWLLDTLVYALCEVEEFDEVLRIMQHRYHMGIDPSHRVVNLANGCATNGSKISSNLWFHVLDTASRAFHIRATRFAHRARADAGNMVLPAGISMNVMLCAARFGDIKLATSAFNDLAKLSGNSIRLHHHECLLEAYLNGSDLRTALSLISTIDQVGFEPSPAVLRPIFMYLKDSRERCIEEMEMLESLRTEGQYAPLATLHVVLEALIHRHDLTNAFHIYDTIPTYRTSSSSTSSPIPLQPNIDTFNHLLRGCHLLKEKSKAMFLASEMAVMEVTPNEVTYDLLILICLDSSQDLNDAWRYVRETREAGFTMKAGTASYMAKVACQASDRRVFLLSAEDGGPLPMATFDRIIREHWRPNRTPRTTTPRMSHVEPPNDNSATDSEHTAHQVTGGGLL